MTEWWKERCLELTLTNKTTFKIKPHLKCNGYLKAGCFRLHHSGRGGDGLRGGKEKNRKRFNEKLDSKQNNKKRF